MVRGSGRSDVVSVALYSLILHQASAFSYLPDLTNDEKVLTHYTSRINVRQFASQAIVVSCIIISNEVRDTINPIDSSIETARLASLISLIGGALLFGYAWLFLFRPRPALSAVPEGSSLLQTGFSQVYRTSGTILRNYRALQWFAFSLLWCPEAGAGIVQSIAITYLVSCSIPLCQL
jgi:hypothetical protein